MKKIDRIIKPDDYHKSRFHDMKGNRVPLSGFVHLPKSVITTCLRLAFGRRPMIPWIPYPFISILEKITGPDCKVIEFGSGMSTIWLARRCGFLLSRENDALWHQKVSDMLAKSIPVPGKIRYEYKTGEQFWDLSEYPDTYFDVCIVDGYERERCVTAVIPKVKKGGFLYLDNSDDRTYQNAEDRLIQYVRAHDDSQHEYITGFIPTYIQPTQGLLCRL